ncbi:MAG: hypothetical protein KZQ99_10905 [Candidatus Thiodiazotropha sp. (ex Dulcina madagascariensis)]|nr:hypothetical protein [Candidatus Thiodiazotropha sp. (ex Dulcina madagascariensis)]
MSALADDDRDKELKIEKATWNAKKKRLTIEGKGKEDERVTVTNAWSGASIGRDNVDDDDEWKVSKKRPSLVPCRVRAESDGESDERDVKNAPDCGGVTPPPPPPVDPPNPPPIGDDDHQNLTYEGPGTCLQCHDSEAHEVHGSTHYQWKGQAPYMVDGNYLLQGKDAGALNTYCGNIEGNWDGCSACHVGMGAKPESYASTAQLENIDCLVCHQSEYKRKKVNGVMVPDTANMSISMDEAVQTVHEPIRQNCLTCHAKAGGGDAIKRGDLALASGNTRDSRYDVHMATTGANLDCQDCHKEENHRFPGKGSDLRPTDLDKPLECASSGCHNSSPHGDRELNSHTARVACQTCHVPVYAKNANDSAATEATETDRSWQSGTHSSQPPYHPVLTKRNNLIPKYLHWDRHTDNYNVGDTIYENRQTGTYQTSVPRGSVDDRESKLYPFKYKTSDYPLDTNSSKLIALDTKVFFGTADADAAATAGLRNLAEKGIPGYRVGDNIRWVTTDTYQLLNHQVSPEDDALDCSSCHMNTSRMDLQGELGYEPRDSNRNTCSSGCHDADDARDWSAGSFNDFRKYHEEHADEGESCNECHSFDR